MDTEHSAPLKLIWGATEIGRVLGVSRRRAFHLLETGELPARKVGGRWVADVASLAELFRRAQKSE